MHFITRINNVLGICVYLYTVGINGAPPAGLEHPSYEHLQSLYTYLTTGYDQRIRPRKNLSESVEVSMSFTIESVTDFDVAGQTLRFMGYFDFFWTDELIVWEPKDYGNLNGNRFRSNTFGRLFFCIQLRMTVEGKSITREMWLLIHSRAAQVGPPRACTMWYVMWISSITHSTNKRAICGYT